MSRPALAVHEVLEEEYVSAWGESPIDGDSPVEQWHVLNEPALRDALSLTADDDLLGWLEKMCKPGQDNEAAAIRRFRKHDRLRPGTKRLIAAYGGADAVHQRRTNRRILEDVAGKALRAAAPAVDIEADQIVDAEFAAQTLAEAESLPRTIPESCRDESRAASAEKVAAALEALRVQTDLSAAQCPAGLFRDARRLSRDTALSIEQYGTFDETDRLRLNRRILDDVFSDGLAAYRDIRLAYLYAELHKRSDDDAPAALCISGGGIRSATFALGVIQGLARLRVLRHFQYLSTVSGGGYIGSWLSSWARRHPKGFAGVEEDLSAVDSQAVAETMAKTQPEAKPIRHLREYSNYLTPRVGVLSGDTWAMLALYLRNLTINLLVLVPVLAGILAIPRLSGWLLTVIGSIPLALLLGASLVSLAAMFWYIGSARPVRHGAGLDDPPEWLRRRTSEQTRFLLFCVVAGGCSAFFLTLLWAKLASVSFDAVGTVDLVLIAAWVVAAIATTTVLPCFVYFRRFRAASYAARRDSIACDDDANRRMVEQRIVWERRGAFLGCLSTIVLLFLLTRIFDRPLAAMPDLETLSPFQLADVSTTPWKLFYICFAGPAVLLVFFIQATIFVAVSGRHNEDYDREWWGRAGGWLLGGAAAWVLFAAVAVFGPLTIYQFPLIVGTLGGTSGLLALGLGRSASSPAQAKQAGKAPLIAAASGLALRVAVPVFALFLLAGLSYLTTAIIQKANRARPPRTREFLAQFKSSAAAKQSVKVVEGKAYVETLKSDPLPLRSPDAYAAIDHLRMVEQPRVLEVLIVLLVALVAARLSRFIGANRFSMHALYRNRLIRAYLGASRYDRDPDRFTGFDPYDNIQMYKLRPELFWSCSFRDLDGFIDELRDGDDAFTSSLVEALQNTTYDLLLGKRTVERLSVQLEKALTRQFDGRAIEDILQGYERHFPAFCERLEDLDGTPTSRALRKLAEALQEDTAAELERIAALGGGAELADALFQDLNRIIIEGDLAKTGPAASPQQRAIANRARLDAQYAKFIIRAAPSKPAGSSKEQLAVRAPLHVINIALNLVSGDKLAWQQRQAESFTVSPLHCGSPYLGYRDAREYGDAERGITLGTAVTISGAAASPNMGYHSSPALAFLLTMFNVRLGWWLGNPGAAGQQTFTAANPDSALDLIWREAAGLTNDSFPWVYLSDGGHFENLGLYEMVLRRCRTIVVSDAGCDPKFTFEDLGNAIRKIRMDLGIPIEISHMYMHPRDPEEPGNYCGIGEILYRAVDGEDAVNGKLIYVKPAVYRDESLPKDVFNYARECTDFPHESTGDQWFSESQFESYRMLGRHVVDRMVGDSAGRFRSVTHFADEVKKRWRGRAEETYLPVVSQLLRVRAVAAPNKPVGGAAPAGPRLLAKKSRAKTP
jgi:hypothetical protein